jgi:hypothetical protein
MPLFLRTIYSALKRHFYFPIKAKLILYLADKIDKITEKEK